MPIPMSYETSTRFAGVTHAPPLTVPAAPAAFAQRLASLYGLAQRSDYVFGSPLGPFYHESRHHAVPRFVYFGPHTSNESLRLAFYAGFDHRDLRGTFGLLHFVERLALSPDLGQGLNLSFFPLLDVLGLTDGEATRDLASAHWARPRAPEISLLEKDACLHGYHGFVRIEAAPGDEVVGIRLRGHPDLRATGVELISSLDTDPLPVRWEAGVDGFLPADGPLSVADDLPFPPFELTLRIPAAWPSELHREAIASTLKRFVLRYRGHQAYAQHL